MVRQARGRSRGRSALAFLSGGLALSLVAGCAQFIVPTPPPPDPAGNFVPLTLPVVALGDTQEHESTGFPLHDNDGAVDTYVEVAQRPPEQPLFGRRILEWVLSSHAGEPVIHLGDLLDMSCESELRRMDEVFAGAAQPFALLPGNHDGLMFGIFNYALLGDLAGSSGHAWYRGCIRGTTEVPGTTERAPRDYAVDKRRFISAYLSRLSVALGARARLQQPPESGEVTFSWRNPEGGAFLEAIEARLREGAAYANSFISQKLRLPPAPGAPRRVTVIGLDTNQVDVFVGTLDTLRRVSPGDIGHVRNDQLDAIAHWIEEARQAGDIVVFAGHHNWNRLSFGSQARLGAAMARLDHPLVYLSAHTHRGYWASHRIARRSLLELNVSSLSDWPISYRRISLGYDEAANRIRVSAEIMPNLGNRPRDDAELLRAWETTVCEKTGYSAFEIEYEDFQVVKAQRESRGTLMDWLLEGLADWCESCQQGLYESGMRYQDALLVAIGQLHADFAGELEEVRALSPPAHCGERSLPDCLASLKAARPADLAETIRLFRKKAQFIDAMNDQFDRLKEPRVRAYMTCRAVVSARIDFELTSEDLRAERSEASRREMDFFRIEATVGMD